MLSNNKEFSLGLGVFVFSLVLLLYIIPETVISPRSVPAAVLAPSFWPNVIAWMLLLMGAVMAAQQFLSKEQAHKRTSRGLPARASSVRLLVFAILLIGYYLALPVIGMVWSSSIAFILFSILICNTKHRKSAVLVGILLPLALYGFFSHVAGVAIPQSEFMRLP